MKFSRVTPHSLFMWPLLAVTVLSIWGCGYSSKAHFPEQVRTIAVPIFDNQTFYRQAERDLTEALVKEIELRTPYKVVARASAESVLEGAIVGIGQRQSIRSPTVGYPREMEVVITVNFDWTDQKSGEVLRTRRGLEAVGRYVPESPVNEPFEVGQHAAVQRLAASIVDTLRETW